MKKKNNDSRTHFCFEAPYSTKCHQCLLIACSLLLIVSLIPLFKMCSSGNKPTAMPLRTLTLDRIAVRCWLQCVMAALFWVSFQIKSHTASVLAAGSYNLRAKYANRKMGIMLSNIPGSS